ncbi:MAG: methyl-accepting chemotaxis protein [Pseudomonadota bacterium]
MKRPIRSLLLGKVLLPLSSLAILLVLYNGWSRYSDAKVALDDAQNLIVDVLRQPAAEAILIGNNEYLIHAIENLAQMEHGAKCILVTDSQKRTVSDYGRCNPQGLTEEGQVYQVITSERSLDEFEESGAEGRTIGEIAVLMKTGALHEQIIRIVMLLAVSIAAIIIVFFGILRILRREVVQPIERINETMSLVRGKDYSARVDSTETQSELSTLTHSINETIQEMERHALELDTKREEAENALLAADTAFIEKESLIQMLMQDVAEPISEITRGLVLLAMDRVGAPDEKTVRRLAEFAKRSGENVSELMHLVMAGGNEIETSLITAGELVDSLEKTLLDLQNKFSIDVKRDQVPQEQSNMTEAAVLKAPTVKLQRLVHTVGTALLDYGEGAEVRANVQLLRTTDEQVAVGLDIRVLSRSALWPEKNNEVETGLPRDIPDRARILVSLLSRELDAHVHSIFGGRNSLLVTIRWQSDIASASTDNVSVEQASSDIAIITNDKSLESIAVKASMAGRKVHVIRPIDVPKRMLDLKQYVDFVAIDVGRGTEDDFDPNYVLESIATQSDSKKYHFIAIIEEDILVDSAIDELFKYGYSSALKKPISWTILLQRVNELSEAQLFDVSDFKDN